MLSRLLTSLFICALALGFGVSSAAAFQKGAAKKATTPSPYAKQIYELHDVKVLLESADHDYKGHRAAAVKSISAAIHALQVGHHHVKHPSEKVKGNNETQSLSDKQLNEALAKLGNIQSQMASATGTAGTATAATELSTACAELKVALTIK